MSFSRKLVALLALLCLFGTQQAAFAHWAAHLGAPAGVGVESRDGDHATAAVLGQLCTSCQAFAGLDAAPSGSQATVPFAISHIKPALPALCGKSVPTIRRYDSRAPPSAL